jgi:hypothetical protein
MARRSAARRRSGRHWCFHFSPSFPETAGRSSQKGSGCYQKLEWKRPIIAAPETIANLYGKGWLCYIRTVRYLVKGRVRMGKEFALLRAIDQGTLGNGSIAGDEYLYDMEQARLNEAGVAQWVETCFCDPPLAEERPFWEEYFELLSVKDAHSRRNCRHENGMEPWACCDCDCTKKLEETLQTQGTPFLDTLRS